MELILDQKAFLLSLALASKNECIKVVEDGTEAQIKAIHSCLDFFNKLRIEKEERTLPVLQTKKLVARILCKRKRVTKTNLEVIRKLIANNVVGVCICICFCLIKLTEDAIAIILSST